MDALDDSKREPSVFAPCLRLGYFRSPGWPLDADNPVSTVSCSHQHWEDFHELVSGIESYIKKYTLSMHKPPFTGAGLAVLARLCIGGIDSCSRDEVFKWILDRFPYYRMVNANLRSAQGVIVDRDLLVVPGLSEAYSNHYLPLAMLHLRDEKKIGPPVGYPVTLVPGRVFLRPTLPLAASYDNFRFLDLPPELRNAIYRCCSYLRAHFIPPLTKARSSKKFFCGAHADLSTIMTTFNLRL
ncbi:hypothetical protein LTR10_006572 [Elasticomyces elasticus]|nr:hypothetical protein LTR10_006572 [Elasticomyces elasticus]KAK4973025.1 hypothetical protein LTR42_006319 [Elasticomyces elasticus]